eukprot:5308821-Amphidinium_carterae.1
MMGKYTHVPIAAVSKRQTCVSHSTPEAEIVAADTALRLVGLPAIPLLEFALGSTAGVGNGSTARSRHGKDGCKIQFQEDNEATIAVFKTGKNPTMRYLGRTHRVSIAWLHEVFKGDNMILNKCDTSLQAADIFTKSFTD